MAEVWKIYPKDSYYEVSTAGRVRSIKGIRRPFINHHGYEKLTLRAEKMFVHRMVWLTFMGEIPENMQVNHENGSKTDNHIFNLSIMTESENKKHAKNTGLIVNGEDHPLAKADDRLVKTILMAHYRFNLPAAKIAWIFGKNESTVRSYLSGRRFGHVYQEFMGA